MKLKVCIIIGCTALVAILSAPFSTKAQLARPAVAARTTAYDAAHESVLQGTVLGYTENGPVPPIGAHVTVQTVSGPVDVHLGPASYLRINHFSLVPGDSVRVVGTLSQQGNVRVFLARRAQSGGRAITLRSTRGFLLARSAPRTMSKELRGQTRQGGPR